MFIGAEGYDSDVIQYRSVLECARNNNQRVKLHAGFLPWPFASIAVKKGEQEALEQAKLRHYVSSGE